MANQAIALGARAPQTNIFGGSIQRNAQMMNMMAQQAAAQRQAEKAQQEMTLAQQTADLTAEEKRRAFRKSDMEYLNNQLPGVKDDISWNRWLGELKKVDPGLSDDLLRKTGGRYIPEVVDIIGATAEQWINKNIATPVASFQVSDQGVPQSVTAGGIAPSSKEIPQYRYVPDETAAAATAAPALSEGEAAPILQNAAQSKTITPEDADRVRKSLGPNGGAQFDQWMTRNGIQVKPISFEQDGVEPLTMENAPQIVDAALKSGMIDPSHVEQLKQMVGPENGAAIDQWVQQSGLKVQQGLPGMRSAVYRPQAQDFGAPVADDGMSFGGPANALRQDIGYVPTTTRFKSPTEAPLPGSAQVPIPRVREEAKAQRKTPQETYEETRSIEQAKKDVDFLESVSGARKSAKQALSVIDSMIGDARLNKAGQIEVPRGGRKPHPGFEDVIGATWRPGARLFPGTDAADFDSYLEQAQGSAFLEGFDKLRGGGSITEKEGEKATAALTRMKRSISEKEFVKAARELRDIIAQTIANADAREARLRGTAPRRTPVKKSSGGWGAVEVVGD